MYAHKNIQEAEEAGAAAELQPYNHDVRATVAGLPIAPHSNVTSVPSATLAEEGRTTAKSGPATPSSLSSTCELLEAPSLLLSASQL